MNKNKIKCAYKIYNKLKTYRIIIYFKNKIKILN